MEDGLIAVPKRPGLGIAVREDFLARPYGCAMKALFLGRVVGPMIESPLTLETLANGAPRNDKEGVR